MAVAAGELRRPHFDDPLLEALFARGLEHETQLRRGARSERRAHRRPEPRSQNHADAVERTLAAMREGADVIVQAALSHERLAGPAGRAGQGRGAERARRRGRTRSRTPSSRARRAPARSCSSVSTASCSRPRRASARSTSTSSRRTARHAFRVDDFAAYFRLVRAGLEATSRRTRRSV